MFPDHLRKLLIHRYNDILRVGKMRINGDLVQWETAGPVTMQLQNFIETIFAKLQSTYDAVDEILLQKAVFLFCKAVSMNYAMVNVLELLHRKFGEPCTVHSNCRQGARLEYRLEIRPGDDGLVCVANLQWRLQNNVTIMPSPEGDACAEGAVKGTLSSVQTEFIILRSCGVRVSPYLVKCRAVQSGLCMRMSAARRLDQHCMVVPEALDAEL